MTADRVQRAQELFQQALLRAPAERQAFLEGSGADTDLRAEVESLLEHDGIAGEHFMRLRSGAEDDRTLTKSANMPPGSATAADADSRPAVPDYEIVTFIGKGGFGDVWLARQSLTDVFYAVKTIPRSEIGEIEMEGVRECKQRAGGHPNLLTLEHVGQTDEFYYYVMELADDARGSGVRTPTRYEAATLAEHLKRHGALPAEETVRIIGQLLDGLQHLHDAGLLHRDVKPANIFRKDGRWKLGDMGLITSHSRTEIRAGTPMYAPPEGVSDRSGELFCVGRLLLELITGAAPGASATADRIPRPTDAALIERICGVAARACDPDVGKRFQNASEMRAALLPREPAFRRRRLIAWTGVVLLALVGAALAWELYFKHRPTSLTAGAEPTLQVYFKPPGDDAGYYLLDERRVPLKTDTRIWIRAALQTPGFPYMFHIGGGEPPSLLYPDDGSPDRKVGSFDVPPLAENPDDQRWLPLTPPEGTEAFLLLVSDQPVPDRKALTDALTHVRFPPLDESSLLVGDADNPILRWNPTRGLGKESVIAPRGILRDLPQTWRTRFQHVRLLAFPHVAGETRP
ncbi:Serine/threonine-protein kinase PrkC [Phycisphaerae bacterium RAS1]|nr:Serine/threonine-protein kinase PrkC [Phycisphaerae bacterium RAS1]